MAAELKPGIKISEFMEQFRQQENNEHDGASLDEQVDSLLSSNGQSYTKSLTMDQPPRDEREFLVFDAIVARKEVKYLIFTPAFDASVLPPLISRIEKGMLRIVTLAGMPLSESQATEVFEKLLNKGLQVFSMFLRKDYCPEIIHAFNHFLRESSVYLVSLSCQHDEWISTEALQSICAGVLNSSLKNLRLDGLKVRGDNAERVHEILAETILDSASPIQRMQVDADDPGDISLQLLSRVLRQRPALQNLDISFRAEGADDGVDDALIFDRNPWWKQLLTIDDLPLNLWPLFLEKADTWKRDASHSHLDVLNYLLKEKNTELLQNVRRRRIRKRKRYGFEMCSNTK